jgi:hypothetical protein
LRTILEEAVGCDQQATRKGRETEWRWLSTTGSDQRFPLLTLGEVERGGRTKEPGFRVSDARTTHTLLRHLDHQGRGLAEYPGGGRLAVCGAQAGGPSVRAALPSAGDFRSPSADSIRRLPASSGPASAVGDHDDGDVWANDHGCAIIPAGPALNSRSVLNHRGTRSG